MSNLRDNWYNPCYWYEVLFVKFPRHFEKGQSLADILREEMNEGDQFG